MAWSAITDAEIDPESPGTTGLFGKYRDNQEAHHAGGIYARKAANTMRGGGGAVAADPHLTITPVANSIYMVRIVVFVTTSVGATGPDLQFTSPAGSTLLMTYMAADPSAGGGLGVPDLFAGTVGAPTTLTYSGVVTSIPLIFEGTLRTAAAATAFTLDWQGQGAGNTTFLAESYMWVRQPYSDM